MEVSNKDVRALTRIILVNIKSQEYEILSIYLEYSSK